VTETADRPTALVEAPLTTHQQFLCLFDQGGGQGPFGPRYHLPTAWRLRGPVDVDLLEAALAQVVARHEALRTTIVRDAGRPYQRIEAATAPRVEVRELGTVSEHDRGRLAEEVYNDVESQELPVDRLPVLRAVLGRFDDEDAVLVLNCHHTAADLWSMQIILRDLLAFYDDAHGYPGRAPGPVAQYREFADWEQQRSPRILQRNRAYWRTALAGASISALRTDIPRSAGVPKQSAWHRFRVDGGIARSALDLANGTRSSVFMVLMAAYYEFLRRRTGEQDLVVPTFSLGRDQKRFLDTVGPFINFLPIRADLTGAGSFREVLDRTRSATLQAIAHELPFVEVMAESPALMAPLAGDDVQTWAFQAAQLPIPSTGASASGLEYERVWRTLSQPEGADVPDGALWTLQIDASGDMVGSLGFNSNRNTATTMSQAQAEYVAVLGSVLAAPDAALAV
jgi:hypothetical protein